MGSERKRNTDSLYAAAGARMQSNAWCALLVWDVDEEYCTHITEESTNKWPVREQMQVKRQRQGL